MRLRHFPVGILLLMFNAAPAAALQIHGIGSTVDVSPATAPAICLAGGGDNNVWADGWRFALERAGGGDVVIIRATGVHAEYEPWIYFDLGKHGFPRVNSVRTIAIDGPEDANDPEVERLVRGAELVFFDGGDQSRYIHWFRGSRLMRAVEYVMNTKKAPIAGSSAGMALLGGIDFTATYDPPNPDQELVSSEDVLRDPTAQFVDLDRTVLVPPFLDGVITETHLQERNREGRVFGFMARAVYNGFADPLNIRAIGAEAQTAMCYDETGKTRVFGTGDVVFLQGNAPIERILPGVPLHWYADRKAVRAYVISGKDADASFDLASWTGVGGREQFWWVDGISSPEPRFVMETAFRRN